MSPPKTTKSARARHSRTREYLAPEEVSKLLTAARDGATRNPERDHCLLGLMFRHGLRVSEAIGLRMNDIDLTQSTFHVRRLKDSASGAHPIYKDDRRALSAWIKARKTMKPDNDFLFVSERRTQLNRTSVWEIVRVVAAAARLNHLNVHPHSLRHACGYDLINRDVDVRRVQSFLGHKSIQTTTRYTQLAANGFVNFY